jgi:hypothetical protein
LAHIFLNPHGRIQCPIYINFELDAFYLPETYPRTLGNFIDFYEVSGHDLEKIGRLAVNSSFWDMDGTHETEQRDDMTMEVLRPFTVLEGFLSLWGVCGLESKMYPQLSGNPGITCHESPPDMVTRRFNKHERRAMASCIREVVEEWLEGKEACGVEKFER